MSLVTLCEECMSYKHRCTCDAGQQDADGGSGWAEANDDPRCPCGAPALDGGWCTECADRVADAAVDEMRQTRRDREQAAADADNDRRWQ